MKSSRWPCYREVGRLGHRSQDKVLQAFPRSLHYHVGMCIHGAHGVGAGGFDIRDANPRAASRSLHRARSSLPRSERELSRGKARRSAAWRLPAAGFPTGFSRNYSSGENLWHVATWRKGDPFFIGALGNVGAYSLRLVFSFSLFSFIFALVDENLRRWKDGRGGRRSRRPSVVIRRYRARYTDALSRLAHCAI